MLGYRFHGGRVCFFRFSSPHQSAAHVGFNTDFHGIKRISAIIVLICAPVCVICVYNMPRQRCSDPELQQKK